MILLTMLVLSQLPSDYLVNIFITSSTLTNFIFMQLGVVFSISTVFYVFFFELPSETEHVTRKVCGTILLMNIGVLDNVSSQHTAFLSLLNITLGIKLLARYNTKFLCFFLIPVLTSAWNPIVIVSQSGTIRQTFLRFKRPWIVYRNLGHQKFHRVENAQPLNP